MQFNKYIKQYIFFLSFSILFLLLERPAHAQSASEKSILILNSYSYKSNIKSGYQSRVWDNEIISSINSEFVNSKQNIDVKVQYMDSSDNFGEEYWGQLYNLYKYKFRHSKFDVIISLDDNAFNFLLKYGDTLFPNTPVVFSGINNFNRSMISNHPLFTGLTKSADAKSTIDIGLKFHPNTKQVFVITDKTPSGIMYRKLIEDLIPLYKDKVNFLFCDEDNITKVKEKIKNLPKDTFIYFESILKNDKGKDLSIEQSVDILFKDIDIPMYSRSYIQLNNESVGGMITDGYDLGKEIGSLSLRILDGEKPSNIPVTEDSSHRYVFNYEKLKKFNINLNAIPEGSEIVNKPSTSYNISKKLALYIIASILCIIIGGMSFVIFNIYKRKLAERLLSDTESLLSTLLNSTPNLIYFKDSKGKFIEINKTALNLLDINEKEYKNKSVHDLTNISVPSKYMLARWESNDIKAWELNSIHRDEEIIFNEKKKINKVYDILRIPLFNGDGTRKGLMSLGIDVTDHKHNEKNEKIIKDLIYYDKLKTNFFSNISHELRTPLNLIFSALQVIELKNNSVKLQDKGIEKYISIMRQNCYRLLRIISNLIDITKIDAGHFFTHSQNKDIVNVIENIVLSVVDYVESKDISITFDTEIEEKIMAFDPDAMERIILNLLSNCVKFTPNGGSIEVNLYDKIDRIIISIKDTGIGIPTEKQSSIFENFIQIDKSLSRNREGSGIGLSLVKELVVLHDGTIELESAPGEGTEFKIELPIKLLPEHESPTEFSSYTNENRIEKIKIEFSDIYS